MDRIIKQSAKICTYPEIKTKQIHKELSEYRHTYTYIIYSMYTHTIALAHTHVHTHHAHAHTRTHTHKHTHTHVQCPPFLSRFHQQSPAEEASKALGTQQAQHVYPTTRTPIYVHSTRCCIHTLGNPHSYQYCQDTS